MRDPDQESPPTAPLPLDYAPPKSTSVARVFALIAAVLSGLAGTLFATLGFVGLIGVLVSTRISVEAWARTFMIWVIAIGLFYAAFRLTDVGKPKRKPRHRR
jgi:hypothetical protein